MTVMGTARQVHSGVASQGRWCDQASWWQESHSRAGTGEVGVDTVSGAIVGVSGVVLIMSGQPPYPRLRKMRSTTATTRAVVL